MLLSDETRREFAKRGYIVVPAVLSPQEVGAAMIVVDDFVAQTPPPDGHRGHHFYWPALTPRHPLLSLLLDGAAFDVAEQLIRPGRLEVPRQAQVALNIPPYDHRPGRGHLDGATPPESDGRPGTFTMLAGLLLTDQTSENAGNLWVWPGTHRAARGAFPRTGAGCASTFARAPRHHATGAGAGARARGRPPARPLHAQPQYRRQHVAERPARHLLPATA